MPQPPWIFLSYRRAANGRFLADRIAAELEVKCGPNSVFVDSKSIKAGAHWTREILDALRQCVAVIFIIEKNWSAEKLHDPNDWVRLEISHALNHGKYLLPLFIDGAGMPTQDSLPEEILGFAERQGVFIDSRSNEVFAAALSVVSDYVRRSCPSTLVFEREPDKKGLASNNWQLRCDGKALIELEESDTAKKAKLPSGVHSLQAAWFESYPDRNSHNRDASFGARSRGETEVITMPLLPGKYRLTLHIDEAAQSRRSWLRKCGDFVNNRYDLLRCLNVVSFDRTDVPREEHI